MSSQHHFDIAIATKYGVNVAIFLNNIAYWIEINMANERHFYEDCYWTYNTQKAFCILFPYWSRQEIRTIINKCIKNDLIKKGNFNENKYDQTTWYALTKEGLTLFPRLNNIKNSNKINNGCTQPDKGLESTTQAVEVNQPIPNINTDIKTNEREARAQSITDNPKADETYALADCVNTYKPDEHDYEVGKKYNIDLNTVFLMFIQHLKLKNKHEFKKEEWKIWLMREIQFSKKMLQ